MNQAIDLSHYDKGLFTFQARFLEVGAPQKLSNASNTNLDLIVVFLIFFLLIIILLLVAYIAGMKAGIGQSDRRRY